MISGRGSAADAATMVVRRLDANARGTPSRCRRRRRLVQVQVAAKRSATRSSSYEKSTRELVIFVVLVITPREDRGARRVPRRSAPGTGRRGSGFGVGAAADAVFSGRWLRAAAGVSVVALINSSTSRKGFRPPPGQPRAGHTAADRRRSGGRGHRARRTCVRAGRRRHRRCCCSGRRCRFRLRRCCYYCCRALCRSGSRGRAGVSRSYPAGAGLGGDNSNRQVAFVFVITVVVAVVVAAAGSNASGALLVHRVHFCQVCLRCRWC